MKHSFIYRLIIILVLIFSSGVFYAYWKQTKENPFTAIVNDISRDTNLDTSRHYLGKDGVAQSDILILNYDIPTVYAKGKILAYQLVENPQTNENELYVKFFTEGKVLSVRIDYLRSTKIKDRFIIKELGREEKDYAIKMLDKGKSGLPLVEGNFVILSSIQNTKQQELCKEFHSFDLGERWCGFDPNKKSYTREELLKQLLKNLKANSQSAIGNMKFSEYLSLEGNVSATLQINYKVPEEARNSLR